MRVRLEKTEFKEVPAGVSKAGKSYDAFSELTWFFKVIDGDWAGRNLRARTPGKLAQGNRYYGYVVALLGREPNLGEVIDTDDLDALEADAMVGVDSYNGKTYNNISDLFAPTDGFAVDFGDSEPPF